eukprot:gene9520-9685_t
MADLIQPLATNKPCRAAAGVGHWVYWPNVPRALQQSLDVGARWVASQPLNLPPADEQPRSSAGTAAADDLDGGGCAVTGRAVAAHPAWAPQPSLLPQLLPKLQGIDPKLLGPQDSLQAAHVAQAAHVVSAGRKVQAVQELGLVPLQQLSDGFLAAATGHASSAPLLLTQQQQMRQVLRQGRVDEGQHQPSLIPQPQQQLNMLEAPAAMAFADQMILQQQAAGVVHVIGA